MTLQCGERGQPSLLVAGGIECQPVPLARADVALGAELWAGPGEGEVHIEENSAESQSGCPDSNWGPLRPERSALPGCATPREAPTLAKPVQTREPLREHAHERGAGEPDDVEVVAVDALD